MTSKQLKISTIVLLSPLLITFFLNITNLIDNNIFYSILIAGVIIIINFILYLLFFNLSIGKKNNLFLIYIMGGMGVRLFIVLLLVLISLKFLKIDETGFIFALFVWYVLSLTVEIVLVKGKLNNKV
jgi:hypothetical protein